MQLLHLFHVMQGKQKGVGLQLCSDLFPALVWPCVDCFEYLVTSMAFAMLDIIASCPLLQAAQVICMQFIL